MYNKQIKVSNFNKMHWFIYFTVTCYKSLFISVFSLNKYSICVLVLFLCNRSQNTHPLVHVSADIFGIIVSFSAASLTP